MAARRFRRAQSRRFRLTVVEGPKAGLTWESSSDRCSIGFHPSNDLVVEDATVSRFHCEVRIADDGRARARSRQPQRHRRRRRARRRRVLARGLAAQARARRRCASSSRPSRTGCRCRRATRSASWSARRWRCARRSRCSSARRESDATVLLEGETGTGKGVAAEAIHRASARARRAVPGRRLRRDSAEPARVRAVRAREGRVHRRGVAARGRVRRGVGRHHLPRRDRRAGAGPAAEAAARARVARSIRRVGGNSHGQDRRARGGGDQPRPARRGQRRALPQRSRTSGSRW